MQRCLVLVAALVALPQGAAFAQGFADPMEEQRCVWRCLYQSSGAASPEYALCVEQVCNEQILDDTEPAAATPVRSAPRWFTGATSDGRGRFAGVFDSAWGTSFFVMCGPDGRRYFALFGPEGPGGPLTLTISSQTFALNFVAENGGYYAASASDLREVKALRDASELVIQNPAGTALLNITLNGAADAMASACP